MTNLEKEFTQLVAEHKSTIYTVCLMFADEDREQLATVDDLVQETLINLWKGFANFEGRSDIKTWFYRVAMNTCISYDRKRKRHNEVPLELEHHDFLTDERREDARQTKMLRQRIQALGPFDRAIVLLWLEDMTYEEIAAIVGISVKNVGIRLYRIKEKLKNM